MAVKILAPVQPVPPAPMPALPHTPVQIDGMSVTPYVYGNGRLAKPGMQPGRCLGKAHINGTKPRFHDRKRGFLAGGRYWARTSDPSLVRSHDRLCVPLSWTCFTPSPPSRKPSVRANGTLMAR
ncbi:hypothetical protein GCM10012289_66440 [Nonomuraea cavernae]|uniref:Uncharacterized protein n=1 Tax=Nonomuraea cavernae TaxID=2045107 RepID=A0A918DS65_9ACTN|nr:hypothetical protein GCM10012289_66440 [Nonomuraea cavernae]